MQVVSRLALVLALVGTPAVSTAQEYPGSLATSSLVSRIEIERLQASTVLDVIKVMPGVSVVEYGGRGAVASVFARGSESDHVLVLIDGARVASATLGQYSLEHLPLDQVESIELVRGPRASVHGSDAIGGVLHIRTRRGSGGASFANAVTGSHGRYDASAGATTSWSGGWASFLGTATSEDGINACEGSLSYGCFVESEPDLDGYRSGSASASAGLSLGERGELAGRFLYTRGRVDYDGGFVNESQATTRLVGATLLLAPTASWQVDLSGSGSLDDLESLYAGEPRSDYATRRSEFRVENRAAAGAWSFSAGFDLRRERVQGSTDYEIAERSNAAGFARAFGDLGPLNLEATGRVDGDEQFGRASTGSVAVRWTALDGLRLTALAGTAFRAPNFNELYWPGFGNPKLEPEESRSYEAGIEADLGSTSLELQAFATEYDNLIAFDASVFLPGNLAESRVRGLEAGLRGSLAGFAVRGALTLLDPVHLVAEGEDLQLARRPRRALSVNADRSFGNFSAGASLRAEGARYDDLANTRELEGFRLVGLRAEYELREGWTLGLKAENLLDADYMTVAGYNQPGRGLFFTLRVR